jgi:hypothetical protein
MAITINEIRRYADRAWEATSLAKSLPDKCLTLQNKVGYINNLTIASSDPKKDIILEKLMEVENICKATSLNAKKGDSYAVSADLAFKSCNERIKALQQKLPKSKPCDLAPPKYGISETLEKASSRAAVLVNETRAYAKKARQCLASLEKKPPRRQPPPKPVVDRPKKFDPNKPFKVEAVMVREEGYRCKVGANKYMEVNRTYPEGAQLIVSQNGRKYEFSDQAAFKLLIKVGFVRHSKSCGYITTAKFAKFGPGYTQGAQGAGSDGQYGAAYCRNKCSKSRGKAFNDCVKFCLNWLNNECTERCRKCGRYIKLRDEKDCKARCAESGLKYDPCKSRSKPSPKYPKGSCEWKCRGREGQLFDQCVRECRYGYTDPCIRDCMKCGNMTRPDCDSWCHTYKSFRCYR